jgi:diguanylate cyclase (GGDEF)-like protein/PAS domain S-box-containing protein
MTDTTPSDPIIDPSGPVDVPVPGADRQVRGTDMPARGADVPSMGAEGPVVALEQGQDRIKHLLSRLQGAAGATETEATPAGETRFENQLAVVRLGMASSLYYALRTKHAPTAAHCLRVALSCSAWSARLGLDEATRDRIEVAALLHDVGKIGIPDRILRKPGRLTADEQLVMDCCPQLGCEILRGCTGDNELLDIVLYCGTWFDSRRDEDGPRGETLPLGSRMLAIADAFDAMTTDTVYRAALSRERAIQELIDGSCSQFDSELAIDFNRMLEDKPEILHGVVVDRWLNQLKSGTGNSMWESRTVTVPTATPTESSSGLFYRHLVSNIKDGVIFTDTEGTIIQWNDRMRDLTSISPSAIVGKSWTNECVRLREQDSSRKDGPSLIEECLATGSAIGRTMLIEQPGAEPTPVRIQVSPVSSSAGVLGAVIIVRDLSERANLKKQLKSLHHKTTRDPLTGVANRSHFDTVLRQFTQSASRGGETFSLIICDIDHFKRVNDVHGHPAGDEALISFAKILSAHSRDHDLVARYGGEEFLLLAPKCDNATAATRAEAIRQALEQTPLPSLGGEPVTASFGVTEYQSGDTAESVLARSDRALLKAKDNGRNRVIQLGTGNKAVTVSSKAKTSWFGWFDADASAGRSEFDIVAPVPCDLAIDKLRGFIADHSAEVVNVRESQVSLKLSVRCQRGGRRRIDRRIGIRAELTMSEHRDQALENGGLQKTNVHVILEPVRNRDRRSRELTECFNHVLTSLNSYLMGRIRHSDLT